MVPTMFSGKPAASAALRPTLTRLVTDLHDAAHDHVLDQRRVDARALDEGLERVRGQVDGVGVRELAVAAAERAADCVDDDCGGHVVPPDART